MLDDLKSISDDMHAAIAAGTPIADIIEKMTELSEHMNLLLVPEEKKTNKFNLQHLSEEEKKELAEALKSDMKKAA